ALICCFFFLTDPASPVLYTLSLHDALPIFGLELDRRVGQRREDHLVGRALEDVVTVGRRRQHFLRGHRTADAAQVLDDDLGGVRDRKSTRLNSSHVEISYAVFCLKKKKKKR